MGKTYETMMEVLGAGEQNGNILPNGEVIPSKETVQALYIYENVLKITKEVFGQNIYSDVIKAAIEAASYGMWRSIMGESKPPVSGRTRF